MCIWRGSEFNHLYDMYNREQSCVLKMSKAKFKILSTELYKIKALLSL